MTREQLLRLLRETAEHKGGEDAESSHVLAEDALLDYINDDEIKRAWKAASHFWWYA